MCDATEFWLVGCRTKLGGRLTNGRWKVAVEEYEEVKPTSCVCVYVFACEGEGESVDVEPACVCAHTFLIGKHDDKAIESSRNPVGKQFSCECEQFSNCVEKTFPENPRMNLESCYTVAFSTSIPYCSTLDWYLVL